MDGFSREMVDLICNNSQFLTVSLLTAVCYLIGVLLDPIASDVGSKIGKDENMAFESFLTTGKCERYAVLANHIEIKDILTGGKCVEMKLLRDKAQALAFAHASEFQLGRIEAFHRLNTFFRNLMTTTIVSAAIVVAGLWCEKNAVCAIAITVGVAAALIIFFRYASYRHLINYYNIVLGAVYTSRHKH